MVGADVNAAAHPIIKDNTGENISTKNRHFCELTGLYWIWKNTNAEFVGLAHYRRFFAGLSRRRSDHVAGILTRAELKKVFQHSDLIVPKPYVFKHETVQEQYQRAHIAHDLDVLKHVIEELSPDYLDAFCAVMAGNMISRYNMFVGRRQLLVDYCEWLFPILFELESRVDISNYDAYQARVFGFLSERLMTVWLHKQRPGVVYWPVRSVKDFQKKPSFRIKQYSRLVAYYHFPSLVRQVNFDW